jgi:lipopolysaccharide heptosyltransferase II
MLSGYGWYAVSALATSLHPRIRSPEDLRRVLVLKTDHVGDFLLCLPAVRDFAAAAPRAEVGIAVGGVNVPLAERVPWLREVHAYDSPRYARGATPSPDGRLREILARDWDLVIDLTNDPASALAAFRRPSRHRVDLGTHRMREKAKALAGRGRGLRDEHVTRVFYRALGMQPPATIVPEGLVPREEERREAARLLGRGWPGDGPVAAVHAGATWEFRQWPEARFAEVCRELERRGFAAVLVGGPNDRPASEAVARAAGLRAERNLAGATDLPTAAAVLERCAVLVANDGGLMHLAAAQGTPVVGIFGPTNPNAFGPLGETSRALWKRRDCAPCEQRHCIWKRARCLEPIETGEVLAAVEEVARR